MVDVTVTRAVVPSHIVNYWARVTGGKYTSLRELMVTSNVVRFTHDHVRRRFSHDPLPSLADQETAATAVAAHIATEWESRLTKLDPYHYCARVSGTMKTTHGAFKGWCRSLAHALFQ
jgi:hypothetical protein